MSRKNSLKPLNKRLTRGQRNTREYRLKWRQQGTNETQAKDYRIPLGDDFLTGATFWRKLKWNMK